MNKTFIEKKHFMTGDAWQGLRIKTDDFYLNEKQEKVIR